MKIDRDKFKYRVGDKVYKRGTTAEYKIIGVQEYSSRYGYDSYHYRLVNTSPGCLDSPFWLSAGIVFEYYEPCNGAIKVLFGINRGNEVTSATMSANTAVKGKMGGLGGD